MRIALSNHKPDDCTKEEWVATWENAGYALRPLYQYLLDQIAANSSIKTDDFKVANHYQQLIYQGAKREAYQELIDVLPDSAKNI